MPFHKPLVQEFQRAEEAELARQSESDAADDEWVRNMEARAAVRARLSSSAFPTEQPASPTLAADELQSSAAPPMPASPTEQFASPTLAADELQSSAVPSMPAPPTEQPAPPVRSQDAQSAKGCDSASRVRRPSSQHPGTPLTGTKHKGYVSPDLAPPPPAGTKRKVTLSPVVECVNRLVNLQPADSTTRPIATPARRPEGSPLQCGLAVPRCETEVQDQIVANQSVANPPAVPIAASQTALVAFEPEAAGNSGAGQLLAEYYSMLASCTTQVACAY